VRSSALLIGISYSVLVVAVTAVACWFAFTTRSRRRELDAERAAEREKLWLVLVAVMLAVLLGSTIAFVPYGESASSDAQIVHVIGRQFGWQLSRPQVRAGVPVQFRAESADVNHGFGVYDRDDRLMAQTQVLPGREQRLEVTFDEPGRYRILCLEFCGVGHHLMVAQLEVVP
jgi:cytochrome c oxidase subunit 2